ncbi:unnamed protein product, partial [Meganyctiphanes norvegica]
MTIISASTFGLPDDCQVLLAIWAWILENPVLGQSLRDMESIEVENPYVNHDTDGEWGDDEHCPTGHAFAFEVKNEEQGSADWTAVNAVKLYCRDGNGLLTGTITSLEGKYGDWVGIRSCPNVNDKMTGFRLRVMPYQGTFGDDWAVDNVEINCSSNTTLNGMGDSVSQKQMPADNQKFPARSISEHMEVVEISTKEMSLIHGEWTDWAHCSKGYSICGLKTLVEYERQFLSEGGGVVRDDNLYCPNS